jgi:hypothetical protein
LPHEYADPRYRVWLLRARRKRPSKSHAAKAGNELAPSHSITSSLMAFPKAQDYATHGLRLQHGFMAGGMVVRGHIARQQSRAADV